MQIENWPLDRLKPYANNPRQNQEAVPAVVASIREFGFKVPIIADRDGVIVAGHTRDSSNLWTYVLSYADCFRVTEAALNTPPGFEAKVVHTGSNPGNHNGAFASNHPSGAQFLFADGHVEFISEGIDLDTYQNLSTIAGTPLEMDLRDEKYCDDHNY